MQFDAFPLCHAAGLLASLGMTLAYIGLVISMRMQSKTNAGAYYAAIGFFHALLWASKMAEFPLEFDHAVA